MIHMYVYYSVVLQYSRQKHRSASYHTWLVAPPNQISLYRIVLYCIVSYRLTLMMKMIMMMITTMTTTMMMMMMIIIELNHNKQHTTATKQQQTTKNIYHNSFWLINRLPNWAHIYKNCCWKDGSSCISVCLSVWWVLAKVC